MPAPCPHCKAMNPGPGAFCTACGKALPSATSSGPRILGQNELASSAAGASLQSDELIRQTRGAFGALLAVGIIQIIATVAMYALGQASVAGVTIDATTVVFMAGIGVVFLGLAAWARNTPLPAAIVGLVLYVSILTLDGVVGIAQGHPEVITQGILVKVIVIACLAKAVNAGVKYKALRQQHPAFENQQQNRGSMAA